MIEIFNPEYDIMISPHRPHTYTKHTSLILAIYIGVLYLFVLQALSTVEMPSNRLGTTSRNSGRGRSSNGKSSRTVKRS